MSKNKNQKAKGEQPKASEFTTKAGPKSGGVKGKSKKAQAKKSQAIDFREERRIWAEVKANQAKDNVDKAREAFPENVVTIIDAVIRAMFGKDALEKMENGNPSIKKVGFDHGVKRAVFNAIRKALVAESYFSWDNDDKEYRQFQQDFNVLWRELEDMSRNANKAYGHLHM